MKLDILVLASHPDDAELGCGGTIAKHVNLGFKVGIADFTRGELSTRGTVQSRNLEAKISADVLGLSVRENLNFKDGFFKNDESHQRKVIGVIRRYQPDIVLANAIFDRHPDHGRGATLAFESCFFSGLAKIKTYYKKKKQPAWRPKALYHYIQSLAVSPNVVVDVSAHWEQKKKAIHSFKSQFYDPNSDEPDTYISKKGFLNMIEARGIELGQSIGVQYGEGFITHKSIGIDTFKSII